MLLIKICQQDITKITKENWKKRLVEGKNRKSKVYLSIEKIL